MLYEKFDLGHGWIAQFYQGTTGAGLSLSHEQGAYFELPPESVKRLKGIFDQIDSKIEATEKKLLTP